VTNLGSRLKCLLKVLQHLLRQLICLKIFFLSRSCRHGYPVAPLIYKLQAGKNDLKEIKLPGELGGAELENKISMLTDDTQLFNKYERYVGK
jgi:hypothetical protein